MNKPFAAHVRGLDPAGQDAAELEAAAISSEALMAYAEKRGLELTPAEAEHIITAAAGPLDDAELSRVAGGWGIYKALHYFED